MHGETNRLARIVHASEAELTVRSLRANTPPPVLVVAGEATVLVMVDRLGTIGIIGRYDVRLRSAVLAHARELQVFAAQLREAIAFAAQLRREQSGGGVHEESANADAHSMGLPPGSYRYKAHS